MIRILLPLVITFYVSLQTLQAKEEEYVDHVSLASLMIYDGNYKKAQQELQAVDKKSKKFDPAEYHTVGAVLASKQGDHQLAIQRYLKAIEATKTKEFKAPKVYQKKEYLFEIGTKKQVKKQEFDPEKVRSEKLSDLYMYLATEYYKNKEYTKTITALDNAGIKGKAKPSLFTLRADCYWKVKDPENAIKSLNEGLEKFPKENALIKQKFYYYADLKLYQAALATAKTYIKSTNAGVDEYIATAQVLISANQIDQAIKFLEAAKLKFPKDPKIALLLGHMYLKKGYYQASAHLFDESAYLDKANLNDAVEINKRAGNVFHALYLNSQNHDKIAKLKQKIAIYLESQEFSKIIGLQKALQRYKMLDDENLRYTLAYAYYMVGDYKQSESQLKYITNDELFSKATVIRSNIEKCTNNTLECL